MYGKWTFASLNSRLEGNREERRDVKAFYFTTQSVVVIVTMRIRPTDRPSLGLRC